MQTLVRILTLGALLSAGAAATPIYQVNFTGTIISGAAFALNLANNQLQPVQNLTGLAISGSMVFDLGLAPAATVNVDSNGFTNTSIQSNGGPIFVSEIAAITGLTNPGAGFLPIPSQYNMAPIPTLPVGTTVTQTQDGETLQFSSKPTGGSQSVISGANFQYSWSNPQMSGSDTVELNLLIASGVNDPHYFTFPPTGQLPSSFGPVSAGLNGVFNFGLILQNAGVTDPAQNFGVTTDYDVNGSFTFNSADGVLVAPEPGTLAMTGTSLLALAIVWRRRRSALLGQDRPGYSSRKPMGSTRVARRADR